jgi:hypothetical protein
MSATGHGPVRWLAQPRPIFSLALLVYPIGRTLVKCDRFGIPSTSLWTGAAIIA